MRKLYYLALIALLVSCKKDEDPAPVSIGFASASSAAVESEGSQSIIISFDRATDEAIELGFTVSGDAALNGDYKSLSASPLAIPAGVTSASIDFDLIDELIIEDADKTLVFTLSSASTGMLNSGGNLTHTFTLSDNDAIPNNALQVDLTWDLGEGVDIDLVDLDEIFITNLVESGGVVTGFDEYTASVGENASGFETILLVNTAPDDEYYVLVAYYEGSQSVDFTLGIRSASLAGDATGNFTAGDSGSGLIVGPIFKTGSTYSGRTSAPQHLRTYSVSGKALKDLLSK